MRILWIRNRTSSNVCLIPRGLKLRRQQLWRKQMLTVPIYAKTLFRVTPMLQHVGLGNAAAQPSEQEQARPNTKSAWQQAPPCSQRLLESNGLLPALRMQFILQLSRASYCFPCWAYRFDRIQIFYAIYRHHKFNNFNII